MGRNCTTRERPPAVGWWHADLFAASVLQDQLAACTSLYVEDQLSVHFQDLVDFVKKAEQQQKRNAIPDGQPISGEVVITHCSSISSCSVECGEATLLQQLHYVLHCVVCFRLHTC